MSDARDLELTNNLYLRLYDSYGSHAASIYAYICLIKENPHFPGYLEELHRQEVRVKILQMKMERLVDEYAVWREEND